ncbi:MAG TPA: hypothetical protein VN626_00220 [Clostridia bacterium]|nr:hypothetical protein [Clostridia bacterium]
MTSTKLAKIVSQFASSVAATATYKLGGVEQQATVTTVISGTTARAFVEVAAAVSGTISNIKLFDKDGDLISENDLSIVKPAGKKYYVAFLYQFTEKAV